MNLERDYTAGKACSIRSRVLTEAVFPSVLGINARRPGSSAVEPNYFDYLNVVIKSRKSRDYARQFETAKRADGCCEFKPVSRFEGTNNWIIRV